MLKNGTSAVVICSPFVGCQPGGSSIVALDPIRHFDRQRCETLIPMRQVDAERPYDLLEAPARVDRRKAPPSRRRTLRHAAPRPVDHADL